MAVTSGYGPPPPSGCEAASDEGELYHDLARDVWYECLFDERTRSRSWTALPPSDDGAE
jgi:hypothetical protein